MSSCGHNEFKCIFRKSNPIITRSVGPTTLVMDTGHSWGHSTLQWRHNGRGSVSNHQPHDCLLNRWFRRRSKKTSKLRVTGICAGNSPVTGEFPTQRASNTENVSIWWRHHGVMSWAQKLAGVCLRHVVIFDFLYRTVQWRDPSVPCTLIWYPFTWDTNRYSYISQFEHNIPVIYLRLGLTYTKRIKPKLETSWSYMWLKLSLF